MVNITFITENMKLRVAKRGDRVLALDTGNAIYYTTPDAVELNTLVNWVKTNPAHVGKSLLSLKDSFTLITQEGIKKLYSALRAS